MAGERDREKKQSVNTWNICIYFKCFSWVVWPRPQEKKDEINQTNLSIILMATSSFPEHPKPNCPCRRERGAKKHTRWGRTNHSFDWYEYDYHFGVISYRSKRVCSPLICCRREKKTRLNNTSRYEGGKKNWSTNKYSIIWFWSIRNQKNFHRTQIEVERSITSGSFRRQGLG